MQINRTFMSFFVLLVTFSFAVRSGSALTNEWSRRNRGLPNQEAMLQPSDLFRNFPQIKWGMSFAEAKSAIEQAGVRPVGLGNDKTELAWDGKFDGLSGRGTVLFKEGAGVYEIAVIAYAMEKQQEVFLAWQKKVTERHGPAKEAEDNIAISNVWKLKDGFVIELRSIKDVNSPVIDIHWVRE